MRIEKIRTAKEMIRFRGFALELDASQIIDDDPGAGTPAIVTGPRGSSGTYWAALDNGELICGPENVTIPADVMRWLEAQQDKVDEFMSRDWQVTP